MPGISQQLKQPTFDVDQDGNLDSCFWDYLQALPEEAPPSDTVNAAPFSDDHGTKRRKINPNDQSITRCIAQSRISLTRRLSPGESEPFNFVKRNVNTVLNLKTNDNAFHITARPKKGYQPMWAVISLTQSEMPQDEEVHRVVEAACSPRASSDQPGSNWTTVDMEVSCHQDRVSISFVFKLHWNESRTLRDASMIKQGSRSLPLHNLFPDMSSVTKGSSSPMDFYDAAYAPPKENAAAATMTVPGLESTLFPYQKRALSWMLGREGVRWVPESHRLETISASNRPWVSTFRKIKDYDGNELFFSDIYRIITSDLNDFRRHESCVNGGILAEEMGLGKTLEVLGLTLLHTRPESDLYEQEGDGLHRSGATLLVAPESLRAQWLSEIATHAPALRVKDYEGCRKLTSQQAAALVQELGSCDIVVTTYRVLTSELHFAREPPERSMRHQKSYERTKSPLPQIAWWRLCLDEAQMIESGFTKAAEVVQSISRTHSWAVTGTPVKDNVKDLHGLLVLLRYPPYYYEVRTWDRLLSNHLSKFQELFKTISLRHTKSMVKSELSIPPQKRFIISMPFTAVEEQHYQSLFKEMTDECGLDKEGSPVTDDWRPEAFEEKMRRWLIRLRQTSLHPEVGARNRRALGQTKGKPIRTVDEVLNAMLEQSDSLIRQEERDWLSQKLTRGQMFENGPRVKEALTIWEEVRIETTRLVADAREALSRTVSGSNLTDLSSSNDLRTDEEFSTGLDSDVDDGEDAEEKKVLSEAKRRLRAALEMHHKAVFFCANAVFQIKEDESFTEPGSAEFKKLKDLEDRDYDEAKSIRKEVLRESHRKAMKLVNRIARHAKNQSFTEIKELVPLDEKGIESGRVVDAIEILYGELNHQANILDELREQTIQLLLKPLVDEEDDVETTGEELGESAKVQEELAVHVQILRAIVADRMDTITGQQNQLVKHENEVALRWAKDGQGPAPERLIALLEMREQFRPKISGMSIRGAVSDLRTLLFRINRDPEQRTPREAAEFRIIANQLKATQHILSEQSQIARKLENEVEQYTAGLNSRLEYYRQLQDVSDSVLPFEGVRNENAVRRIQKSETEHRNKMLTAQAKHRYLLHLKGAGSQTNEPRMCVICQTAFTIGVLTVCGHQFCKQCMMLWFESHHNCPVCKKTLTQANLHNITLKPQQIQVHAEDGRREEVDAATNHISQRSPGLGGNKKTLIYSEFNAEKMAQIRDIDLDGPSFTTKVDTLIRHILWLRENDPGAKSIIFSQFRDFLNVLRNALNHFHIGFASIDDPSGITRFKADPGIEVFLLHARAHSSGLNLVNANHVFLCEPLLNTALELQAIARVDRIGQQHETTVWLYIVSGTVEESIHNLSVRRRMEHMGRHGSGANSVNGKGKSKESTPELLDAKIEEANTLELENATLSKLLSKDKTAGEMVDKGDLWECLFGNVKPQSTRQPHDVDDERFHDQAVMNYLAGEAAASRASNFDTTLASGYHKDIKPKEGI